jgi:hypothetical protein
VKSKVVTVAAWTIAIGRVAWAEVRDRAFKRDREQHIAECRDRENAEPDVVRAEVDSDLAHLGEMFAQLDEIEALVNFDRSDWVAR